MSNKEGAYLSLTYISILGVVGTAFALIIFNRLVQLTSPVFTSFVTYLIPIVAIIWGIIDGEVLIFWHYIGIVLIIVGVAFSNRKKK
jgi:drug/metabolite transporter (DMT)-like permease